MIKERFRQKFDERYEFRLSKELDPELLEKLQAKADDPRGHIVDLIKEYLIRRGRNCALCGQHFNRRELSIDHRRPTNEDGRDNIENLQLLCRKCVQFKGHGTMLDARKRMRATKKHRE